MKDRLITSKSSTISVELWKRYAGDKRTLLEREVIGLLECVPTADMIEIRVVDWGFGQENGADNENSSTGP